MFSDYNGIKLEIVNKEIWENHKYVGIKNSPK